MASSTVTAMVKAGRLALAGVVVIAAGAAVGCGGDEGGDGGANGAPDGSAGSTTGGAGGGVDGTGGSAGSASGGSSGSSDAGPGGSSGAGAAAGAGGVGPVEAGPSQTTSSASDHGVTWTFAEPVLTGRFVTGDPWIVCPATVTAIDPAPASGRNGSVLNLPAVDDRSGWDDRVAANRFDESLRSYPPIDLGSGDRLLSSISVDAPGQVDNWLREGAGERSDSPVWSISVLTCVDSPPPADAFRPSYAEPDAQPTIRTLSDVDRSLLPRLSPPSSMDAGLLTVLADRLTRPWVDNLFFAFDAQVEYMPMYGREMGRVAGIASLMLMLDLPAAQQADQDRLLVGVVQRGIDLWGLVRAGHPGWPAHGGHGSGRKWPIMLAGLLLGDAQMASPSSAFPSARFGEDMQTAFTADLDPPANQTGWWDGATVVYAGHQGVVGGTPVSSDPAWGPYEHLAPEAWLSDIGESYRRCCTSQAWVGQALAARLMNAQAAWGHDAFFAYVDRWMDPTGDSAYTAEILSRAGYDFTAAWAAHGRGWDTFVEDMWAAYR